MRSHRPSPARLALIAAGLLAAIPVAWACAPWLPNWLIGADSLVLSGPLGDFGDEVARLWPGEDPPGSFKAVEGGEISYFGQTVLADSADLEEALAHTPGLLDIQKEAILRNHDRYLADFTGLDRTNLERLLHGVQSKQPGHETVAPAKGIPAEFSDYAEGAVAYHELRLDAAVNAWERLLRRPDAERHYRSTWAAFMLGKVALRTDPATAVTWFRRTRMLASQGFADRLGLAAGSLGWEAWAENALGHEDRALVLYGEQMRTGDPSAFVSLKLTCARILSAGPEALGRVARNPEARPIFTAWMVSHNTEAGAAWQKALRDARVQDADGADRLAWAAYLAGDFDGAAAWLDQARENSPIAKWVRARLLLRDGKLDEARKLLDEAAKELPPLEIDMETAFNIVWETGEIMPAPQRASGEEAAVQLAQSDFTGAMDRFLRSGYWLDAAYLAERVLGADELKAYVDANWPADLAARFQPATGEGEDWDTLVVGGYTEPAPERLAYEIRHLLGRRLAREGHPDGARPYLSGEILTRMEELSTRLAAGRDRGRTAAARAGDLFQAACLLRHHGLELTATEAEPDFAVVDAEYDLTDEFYGLDRKDRLANAVFPPAAGERARLERNRLRPWKRFHYRYRAADLAWEAAKLLPAGDGKAGMLATAGTWIASRDPRDADRFYKELVRCCGSTELGRQADESRWFPEADACSEGDPE